tara:strand:+ start:997 stop:3024 length:2028 start_codon:yes stop_codon:yes gene_type:complete
MNPVAPVNVLLSTDLDNLERVIESGGDIIQAKPGTYLFSAKNTNFVSLNHELRPKSSFLLNLVMQEPDTSVLDNLLPKNVNEFLEDEKAKLRPTFYIMYGLGKNNIRHWGGPFRCELIDFNYYQDTTGTFMIAMTFVPSLPIQSILTLTKMKSEHLTPPTSRGDKQSRNNIGDTGTAVKIGSLRYTDNDVGRALGWRDIRISPKDFIKSVRTLYENYAKHWGIENLLMVFGKEFYDVCMTHLYSPTRQGLYDQQGPSWKKLGFKNYFIPSVPVPIQAARSFLAEFGMTLEIVDVDSTPLFGTWGAKLADIKFVKSSTGLGEIFTDLLEKDVYIDINPKFKNNSDFTEVFNRFYSTLASVKGIPISPEYVVESNTSILKYLIQSGKVKAIKNPSEPLVIIGERNYIARELYDQKARGEILVPLSDERTDPAYKKKLQYYYQNKTSHSFRSNYFEDVGSIGDDQSYEAPVEWDETSDMLTFKANTPDSNILDYNLNLNLATFAQFVRAFSQKPGDKEREFISKCLKLLIPSSKSFDIDGLSNDLVQTMGSSDFKNVGEQVTLTGAGFKSAYSSFIKELSDNGLQGNYMAGSIKTVPYFQLSDNFVLGMPCHIVINKTPNLDNYPIDPEDTKAFFSGKYIILGFRHIITTTEAFSEFEVMRISIKEKKTEDTLVEEEF